MSRIVTAAAMAVLAFSALPASAVESTYKATLSAFMETSWKKVGDFCGIASWHPAIEKCELSEGGKIRTLSLKGGGTIVERLVNRDDNAHSYTYEIVCGPLPVTDYVSTIKVTGDGSGSSIVWTGTYKPKGVSDADAQKTIDGVYKAGVDALAR